MKTIKQLLDFNPCSEGAAFLAKHKTLRSAWKACDRSDWMLWALERLNLLDNKVARTFAVLCAERALPNFEKAYPNDTRPRLAIEAARRLITDQSQAALSAARSAAWVAYSAAWVARSAAYRAASSAAWAAYRAASSAADSAAYNAARAAYNAADNAAWAAYRAADSAADNAGRRWQADQLRKLINPFSK